MKKSWTPQFVTEQILIKTNKKKLRLVPAIQLVTETVFVNISTTVHQQEIELNLPLLATEEVPLQKVQ